MTGRTSGSASRRILADERGGGLVFGDLAQDAVEERPEGCPLRAEDPDERGDRGRLADVRQLLTGLEDPVFGAGDDRLTQEADPTRPRRLLGDRGLARLALFLLVPRDPLALVADQALRLADLVGGEPAVLVQDVAQLPMRGGEGLVVLDGGLIMEPGQVAQLVALAPEAELVLRVGGRRRPIAPDEIFVQRAGLGGHPDDLLFAEDEGRPPLLGQDRHAVGPLPHVRDHLAAHLPAAPEGDHVGEGRCGDEADHPQGEGGDDRSRGPGDRTNGHESTPLPARAGRNGRVNGHSSFYGPPERPDNHLQTGLPIW